MSKVKRILSVIMAMVMVLAMSVPTFASEVGTETAGTASLTVRGLVQGESTTVEVYKVVGWDAENSNWKLGTGVENGDVDLSSDPVTINWRNFVNKKASLEKVADTTVTDGTVTFHGLGIGAYYVYAGSKNTTYNPMGEAVYAYSDTTGLMIAADKTIDAKGSDYTLTKAFTGEDGETTYQVVERGQVVPFTITAVFPSYDKGATERTFQITDEPVGMKVTEVTVKVGGTAVGKDAYTLVGVKADNADDKPIELPASENQKVRVRFSDSFIGTENLHAGQSVTVEVKAQITDADTFKNTASSDKASLPTKEVEGKLGSITINKYNEKGVGENNLLAGAEFSITPVKEGADAIQFVHVEERDGVSVYKKATTEEIANTEIEKVRSIVAKDGKVVAKGLDDGEYIIVETKAPAGYSVVDVDNVTIKNGNDPVATANVTDTKLNALPHTGGIGTTIFTIGGCAIMIVAAGLFFATRRKTQK